MASWRRGEFLAVVINQYGAWRWIIEREFPTGGAELFMEGVADTEAEALVAARRKIADAIKQRNSAAGRTRSAMTNSVVLASSDDHDLVEPRMKILAERLPGLLSPDRRLLLLARSLAIGCPEGYCGRFRSCGVCWMANEIGLFEQLRDAKSWEEED